MLATGLSSHELDRVKNDPSKASLMPKKDSWFLPELVKMTRVLFQHHPPWWCAPSSQEAASWARWLSILRDR